MRWVRRLAVMLCVAGLVGCTSAPGAFRSSPAVAAAPSRFEPRAHPLFGAAIDIPGPARPQTLVAEIIGLYERGEPPTSSPVVTELYRQVCADPARTRTRRSGYDRGDEIARRQDCYCADAMPCSVNRDCTDLVVCYPQLALSDAAEERNASF
jgi:hypothetical protein